MNILWVILWIVLVYDNPETHPFINEDEKGYIVTTRNSKKASQKLKSFHIISKSSHPVRFKFKLSIIRSPRLGKQIFNKILRSCLGYDCLSYSWKLGFLFDHKYDAKVYGKLPAI